MLTLAADPQRAHFSLRTCATVAFILIALVPPLLVLTVLWVWPIAGLTADRTAMAARDYTDMWAAGRFVTVGNYDALFDTAAFNAGLRAMFGAGFPDQMWPYPPPILLLAVPLSALALAAGFLLYTFGSMSLLWLVLRLGGLTKTQCWAVLLSPAVAENALAGQNAALTGAFLLGGLLLAHRRPVLAGVMLGALIIKPQFGMLAPVCLVASDNWRALAAMATSAILLIALSGAVFGLDTWVGFFRHTQPMLSNVLRVPWHGLPWQRIFASPLMAARSIGAGLTVAWSLQAGITLLSVAFAWRIWRAPKADPDHSGIAFWIAGFGRRALGPHLRHDTALGRSRCACCLCIPRGTRVARLCVVLAGGHHDGADPNGVDRGKYSGRRMAGMETCLGRC